MAALKLEFAQGDNHIPSYRLATEMISRELYEYILRYLNSQSVDIIKTENDPENFGNFIIVFSIGLVSKTIGLDRGELYICDDTRNIQDCRTLIHSIYEISEEAIYSVMSRIMK